MDVTNNGKGEGQVVVGIDGSQDSYRALHWAIDEARMRGVGVLIVHALDLGIGAARPYALQHGVFAELTETAQTVLDLSVAHARARAHDVQIEGVLVEGSPGMALVRASDGAVLLVVGSRGHGGLLGAVLGSTSSTCVHQATCPVVVIPPEKPVLRTGEKQSATAESAHDN